MKNPDGRRIGRFRVASQLLRFDFQKELQALMNQVFILHAEHLYSQDCFQYVALSPRFDSIHPGQLPPDYRVIVERRRYVLMDVENFTVRFERVPVGEYAVPLDWSKDTHIGI